MQRTTFKISGAEINAQLLDKIKSLFTGEGKDYEVVVSVHPKGSAKKESPGRLADRFEAAYQQWKSETALLSSGTALVTHPAYLEIMEMGDAVVPFILIKLLEDPHHLFYALFKITGENPVPKKHAGNLPQMTADWLDWGKRQGYLS